MKKLMIVGVFVFAFAFTLNMAMAGVTHRGDDGKCYDNNNQQCACPAITISNLNNASANITTSGVALTGGNKITVPIVEQKKLDWFMPSTVSGTGTIWSGNANVSVGANNTVGLIQTQITSPLPITVNNTNYASANITTKGFAGTGMNTIKGAGTIGSGADVVGVSAINVVGSILNITN